METVNIDLGHKAEECAGCAPSALSEGKQIYYPTLHLEGIDEIDFPESGEMTIKFTRTEKRESTPTNGKARCSYTIEVNKIVSMESDEADAPANNLGKGTEELLDEMMTKLKGKKEEY